jgi:azurin
MLPSVIPEIRGVFDPRQRSPPARWLRWAIMSNRYALAAAILASLAVSACGQSGQPASGPVAPSAAPPPAAATPPAEGRKVEITANDQMKFSLVEIRAKAGERLSVTLVNKGTTPKFSMGHNWVLLGLAANIETFLVAAAEAPTTEYVPAARRADILAATKLLGPGERDTATFAAPAAPGRYPFICSFPGHAQVGMRGVLIVE